MEKMDFEEKLAKAKTGDASAQCAVGYRYSKGSNGAPQDDEAAVEWYTLSAKNGNKVAQYNLGLRYHRGQVVDQDYKTAMTWFMKSALQGYADAQRYIGRYFDEGLGVEKNDMEAFRWYLLSAQNGNAIAQRKVAWFYREGRGTKASEEEAAKWFLASADQGDDYAMNSIALCYSKGNGVEQDYEKAAYYMKAAAEKGNMNALGNLASWYRNGKIMEKDPSEAFRLYHICARKGDTDSQRRLGWFYRDGEGVEKNLEESAKWFLLAADNGDDSAQNSIAICFKTGKGVEKDYEKAVHYMKRSAEQGYLSAICNLATWYKDGVVIEQDLDEALRLYLIGADKGDADAAYNCGMLYLDGTPSMEPDFDKAYSWFAIATERGRDCSFPLRMVQGNLEPDGTESNMRLYAKQIKESECSTIDRVTEDLKTDFGDCWNLVPENAQHSLITGVTGYVDFYNNYANDPRIDYSASILPLCKGLEIILNQYLRERYVNYLHRKGIPAKELQDIRGITYYNRKQALWKYAFKTEDFSLGSVPFVIFDNYTKDRNGSAGEQTLKLNPYFKDYVQNDLFKADQQEDLDDYFNELFACVEEVMMTRNPSSHSHVMNFIKAEICGDILLKVKKLILHLLEKVNPAD